MAQLFPPKIDFGVHETFFQNCSFTLPAGKSFSWTIQQNLPDSVYLDHGCTHINVNDGGTVTHIPAGRRGMFIPNPRFLKNYLPSKPLAQWSRSECEAAVDAFLSSKGGAVDVLTSGAAEAYGDVVDWAQVHGLPQSEWIDRRFKANNPDGFYGGQYDGHLNFLQITGGYSNFAPLRPGFTDPAQALTIASNNFGFNNGFFSAGQYQYREGLINIYCNGALDLWRQLGINMSFYTINNNALQAVGSTRRVFGFAWAGSDQILDQNASGIIHRVAVKNGYTLSPGFEHYSGRYQAMLAFVTLLYLPGIYCWEDTERKGYDNSVLNNDVTYVGTGGITKRAAANGFDPTGAPYPNAPQGLMSGMALGAKLYADACAWAGTTDWQFVRFRNHSSGGYNSKTATYVLDRIDENTAYAFRVGGSGSKCALVVFPAGAGQLQTRDYDIGASSPVTRDTTGLTPYIELFN